MLNISNYLKKFSKNLFSSDEQKKKISEIIKTYTQVDVLPEEIEIKNYNIYLKKTPAVMNKVFIYKNKILEEVSSQIPDLKAVDIR